jgi:hypothetical protein
MVGPFKLRRVQRSNLMSTTARPMSGLQRNLATAALFLTLLAVLAGVLYSAGYRLVRVDTRTAAELSEVLTMGPDFKLDTRAMFSVTLGEDTVVYDASHVQRKAQGYFAAGELVNVLHESYGKDGDDTFFFVQRVRDGFIGFIPASAVKGIPSGKPVYR